MQEKYKKEATMTVRFRLRTLVASDERKKIWVSENGRTNCGGMNRKKAVTWMLIFTLSCKGGREISEKQQCFRLNQYYKKVALFSWRDRNIVVTSIQNHAIHHRSQYRKSISRIFLVHRSSMLDSTVVRFCPVYLRSGSSTTTATTQWLQG